ncbi:MAG: hypothetical protein HY298_02815 [Verrucomicrobia bacterium]|nr:hypothetical protein [Verrucomicrobiota bacterium]
MKRSSSITVRQMIRRLVSFRSQKKAWAGLLLLCLGLPSPLLGQLAITDDFNDGDDLGWTRYTPAAAPPFNAVATFSFPADGVGGKAYEMFGGPPADVTAGPTRLGAFRNDSTYTDFFSSMDILTFDDKLLASICFMGGRINAPGLGTTSGYLVGTGVAGGDAQTALAITLGESEIMLTLLDPFTGGIALLPALQPAKKYRMVFTGSGSDLRAALYDRTDLLEPLARIAALDSTIPSGISGVGAFNASDSGSTDWTWDNYYSTAAPTTPVGFPGTAQVTELIPAPQTLFYSIPAVDPITFAVQTFNTNQINTNAVKLFLNDLEVSTQLVFSNRARGFPFNDPTNANFGVRYTGTLASNTIYNGKIIVLDMAGKGTTNTWVFDTFVTNGTLTIESEDYNYTDQNTLVAGQFQDNPQVSGLMPDGTTQVNGQGPGGNGLGYYAAVGTLNIDYFDTDTSPNATEQQYRNQDGVGTMQNLRGAGDTARHQYLNANVPDYGIYAMQNGEWQNYTRTFPSNNWNVYLRAASQRRSAVRFDEITGDRAATNQSKSIRGYFVIPNTGSSTRYRYVPLTDAVGQPRVLNLAGVRTLRNTYLGGADELELNYLFFTPATSVPPVNRPWIANATPFPGALKADPTSDVQIIILNADTQVNPGSIQLRVDGVDVTSIITVTNTTTEGAGVTVKYVHAGFLPANSVHTVNLVFGDNTSFLQTNEWTYTVQNYTNLALPVPIYLETFDATAEGTLPAGWSQTNNTDPDHVGEDLNDPRSDSYLGWTVIDQNQLSTFGNVRIELPFIVVNDHQVTNLADGKLVYAESDHRSGNQEQYLLSPDFNLTGRSNIFVSYHSVYEQNQDSFGAVEYSLDQGNSWLPVVYMLDQDDAFIGSMGVVDAVSALNTPHTDAAFGASYGTFIRAPISQALAPFISPRIDDDPLESKRVELFPLPAAANQPNVRFRFAQAGTGSWYFGVDHFGLYSIPPGFSNPIQMTVRRAANTVVIEWIGGKPPYQVQKKTSLAAASWVNVGSPGTQTIFTEPLGSGAAFYRIAGQ